MLIAVSVSTLVGIGLGFRIGLFGLILSCGLLALALVALGLPGATVVAALVAYQVAALIGLAVRHGVFGREIDGAGAPAKRTAGKEATPIQIGPRTIAPTSLPN